MTDLEQLILDTLPKPTNGSGDDYQDHRALCRRVGRINRALPWVIGYLLDKRERRWGEKYDDAVEDFWLAEKTLRSYVWVYRNAGMSFRKDQPQLTFSHYLLVAALDEEGQQEWLDRAAEGRWSKERLRVELRRARGLPSALVEIAVEDELEETCVERDRLRAELARAYQQIRELAEQLDACGDESAQPAEPEEPEPPADWPEFTEESVSRGLRRCVCPKCGHEFLCSQCR